MKMYMANIRIYFTNINTNMVLSLEPNEDMKIDLSCYLILVFYLDMPII
jgi:hypothetical protein